jgi:hypothetical protein
MLQCARRQWKLDSVRVNNWKDSLVLKVRKQFYVDSLANLDLYDSLKRKFSTQKIIGRLTGQRDSMVSVIETKRDSVVGKIQASWQSWQGRLSSVKTAGNFSIPDFPVMPQLPELDLNVDLNMYELDLNNFKVGDEMNSMLRSDIALPEISMMPDQDVFERFKIMQADPGKVLEQHLLRSEQVSKMTDYLQAGQNLSSEWIEKARAMRDPEALKNLAREEIVKRSLNHFAGKETAVQQAMEKISKFKCRYSRVKSLTEIPSLPKNAMHGKPFSERFVPGCVIQYQRAKDAHVDLNPYAYYRVTGRLSVGGGWSNRSQVFIGNNHLTMRSPAFGPRIFGEFKTWNGVSGRAEFEGIRAAKLGPGEGHGGEWSIIVRIGLKTEYRLYRNIKGVAQIMMPIAMTGRAQFPRELFTRFGFEFPLKK